MYLHWFSLIFYSCQLLGTRANAFIDHNQTNFSSIIELYQCETNRTIVNSNNIFRNQTLDSCDLDCCKKNHSNQTTFSSVCQVTLQTGTGVCLGRLCYSGECTQFLSSNTTTYIPTTTIKTTKHLLSSTKSWFLLLNNTQIKWPVWRDRSHISIRYGILILLLTANVSFTLVTLFLVIKSIRRAKMIADRKYHRYSLF